MPRYRRSDPPAPGHVPAPVAARQSSRRGPVATAVRSIDSIDEELPGRSTARRSSSAPRGNGCPGFGAAGTTSTSGCTLTVSGGGGCWVGVWGNALSALGRRGSAISSGAEVCSVMASCRPEAPLRGWAEVARPTGPMPQPKAWHRQEPASIIPSPRLPHQARPQPKAPAPGSSLDCFVLPEAARRWRTRDRPGRHAKPQTARSQPLQLPAATRHTPNGGSAHAQAHRRR